MNYSSNGTRPVNGDDREYQWLVKLEGEDRYQLTPHRINEMEVRNWYRKSAEIIHLERLEITKRMPECDYVLTFEGE